MGNNEFDGLNRLKIKATLKVLDTIKVIQAIRCFVVEGIKGWVKWLFGWERLDPDTIAERYGICQACPNYRNRLLFSQCSLCHCVLEVKTTLANSHCDIDKW